MSVVDEEANERWLSSLCPSEDMPSVTVSSETAVDGGERIADLRGAFRCGGRSAGVNDGDADMAESAASDADMLEESESSENLRLCRGRCLQAMDDAAAARPGFGQRAGLSAVAGIWPLCGPG